MTGEFELFGINKKGIWSDIEKSWPGTTVVNAKDIRPYSTVKSCLVLCPLYSPGPLEQSQLIPPPFQIAESRVANKVNAYLQVAGTLIESVKGIGASLTLDVVFANKGVLLGGREPSNHDSALLSYHERLYRDLFAGFALQKGINVSFSNYDDWNVNFPQFVNPSANVPDLGIVPPNIKKEESKMIWQLNRYLTPQELITDNKKNRHVIERAMGIKGLGYAGAFWLIAGYLAFDPNISKITGENGVYLVSERLEPLFGIAHMTKSLSELTRIQIKA